MRSEGRRLLPFVVASAIFFARDGASQAPTATPAPTQAVASDPDLAAAVQALATSSGLSDAQIGIAILDVATNKILAASNEHLPLNPASNAKLFTASSSLAL